MHLKNTLSSSTSPEMQFAIDLGIIVANDVKNGKSYKEALIQRFVILKRILLFLVLF